jgi:hypothetical protein
MERRFAIKQILFMAGGMALLPSCLRDSGKSSIALATIDVSLDQEQLIGDIAETIIPATKTPGAKALNLHLFTLKMLDDCYEKEDQELFFKGLDALQDKSQNQFSKPFQKLAVVERKQLLEAVEKDEQASPELKKFYDIMKSKTIEGYLSSKYVMTNLVVWELVPGRYNPYYPVKKSA